MDTITRQPCTGTNPSPHLQARPLVCRVDLLKLLEASGHATVIAVLAPPGYGKTTLLAQWADRDPRPFAWLAIDHHDNDPAVLLRNLALSLGRSQPLGPGLLEAVPSAGSVIDAVLPQLGSALAAAVAPLVLVLDDLHLLQNWDCLQMVSKLIANCDPVGR